MGTTCLGEEQQETHLGTPESFYEEKIAFIRSHRTLCTTVEAEYLIENLKNGQQNLANARLTAAWPSKLWRAT